MIAFPVTGTRLFVGLAGAFLLVASSASAQAPRVTAASVGGTGSAAPAMDVVSDGEAGEARETAPEAVEEAAMSLPGEPLGRPVPEELAVAVVQPTMVPTFLDRQLAYPRVRRAWERKSDRVEAVLDARGIEDVEEVFFRVFKREHELEVWAREDGAAEFTLVRTYPVCAVSGSLGPKQREGDLQVPEGFYRIDLFNPWSQYHLSMRVDYPNAVDRARGSSGPLGGDIFIHGGCATIGCVPVTDDYIEELYLIAAGARAAGQRRVPVHIFPTRLDHGGMAWLEDHYGAGHRNLTFWKNLQDGYYAFDRTRVLPRIGYDGDRYTFELPLPTPPRAVRVVRSRPFYVGIYH